MYSVVLGSRCLGFSVGSGFRVLGFRILCSHLSLGVA